MPTLTFQRQLTTLHRQSGAIRIPTLERGTRKFSGCKALLGKLRTYKKFYKPANRLKKIDCKKSVQSKQSKRHARMELGRIAREVIKMESTDRKAQREKFVQWNNEELQKIEDFDEVKCNDLRDKLEKKLDELKTKNGFQNDFKVLQDLNMLKKITCEKLKEDKYYVLLSKLFEIAGHIHVALPYDYDYKKKYLTAWWNKEPIDTNENHMDTSEQCHFSDDYFY